MGYEQIEELANQGPRRSVVAWPCLRCGLHRGLHERCPWRRHPPPPRGCTRGRQFDLLELDAQSPCRRPNRFRSSASGRVLDRSSGWLQHHRYGIAPRLFCLQNQRRSLVRNLDAGDGCRSEGHGLWPSVPAALSLVRFHWRSSGRPGQDQARFGLLRDGFPPAGFE